MKSITNVYISHRGLVGCSIKRGVFTMVMWALRVWVLHIMCGNYNLVPITSAVENHTGVILNC